MAITFDGATRRIILDSASTSASEIWSRWVDWHEANSQWPLAMSQVGGDALGGGLFIPPYIFLLNSWRVRPMESNHNLVITGNLFVDGGGVPVVNTLGTYQVNVNYTVPVQAQAFASGATVAPTQQQIRDAMALATSETPATGSIDQKIEAVPAGIMAAAEAAGGIHSDMRKAVGVLYHGDGSESDKLRSTLVP